MKSENTIDRTREFSVCEYLNNNDAKVGVEIGVFKGQFSKSILEGWPGKLYLVDPWRPLGDEYLDSSNHEFHSTAYEDTMNSIKGFEDRAIMVRALSNQAVDLFEDGSLDYVYIDGNHAYDFVKEDLELWWPKLKSGGLMAGHDYLLINWNRLTRGTDSKDIHVYADGDQWQVNLNQLEDCDLPYSGVFGVNPAVHEFAEANGVDYHLTEEWTSTFLIIKP